MESARAHGENARRSVRGWRGLSSLRENEVPRRSTGRKRRSKVRAARRSNRWSGAGRPVFREVSDRPRARGDHEVPSKERDALFGGVLSAQPLERGIPHLLQRLVGVWRLGAPQPNGRLSGRRGRALAWCRRQALRLAFEEPEGLILVLDLIAVDPPRRAGGFDALLQGRFQTGWSWATWAELGRKSGTDERRRASAELAHGMSRF